MRYNLGYLDKYPIETSGSCLENVPMLRVVLKKPVDPLRLEQAVKKALDAYPLFKTEIKFDVEYYLKTNEKPFILLNVKEEDRPREFGKNTNGYPWRIIYHGCTICFEWNHGITDGAGAKTFFEDLIRAYFGYNPVEKSHRFLVAPGIEPFYNTKEKGQNYLNEPQGFDVKYCPRKYQRFETQIHSYECKTEELVNIARLCKTSVAPLLSVLYSKAVRKHIDPKAKNKNVACNITMNVRKILNYESMHNCVDMRRYTYTDEHETMNIATVAQLYKKKLDNNRLEPNIVRSVTERVKVFKAYHLLRFKPLLHLAVKIYGLAVRNTDCNFVLSYLGKWNLPPEIMEKIENMDFRLIPDVGQCIISACDFNGRFNLRVQTDFIDSGIEDDFVAISKSIGLHWEDHGVKTFQQSIYKRK